MTTYVLVHGAWHRGELFEPVADAIRAAGHSVHCPTIAGNRPDDSRRTGLEAAIASIIDYLTENELSDVVLLGHSYGGMVITGVADRVPERLKRLIYWNAFVPNPGEALNDMVPPHYVALFDQMAAASPDNGVMLPFPIWREAFINDADLALAQSAYDRLNPHPYATFTDPITLSRPPAEMELAKSYLNCTEDSALPQSMGWHPRLSEKLGLFRLVQIPGSHELCFTDPAALAAGIMVAGRDSPALMRARRGETGQNRSVGRDMDKPGRLGQKRAGSGVHHDRHPFRPLAHRLAAYRQFAHGAVQPSHRPQEWRAVHPSG